MNALRTFRWIAIAEGLSYLVLLFVAMPLKYLFAMPLAVRVTGGIHGLLFVLFCLALVWVAVARRWPVTRSILAFASSLVPFGTFVLDRWLVREMASGNDSAP
jgi:integral membrane protein